MIDLGSRTAPAEAVAVLGALLSGAGLAVTVREPADEEQMLWEKFALLLPIALLTTRYTAPIGEVRAAHHDELAAVVRELAQVGRAAGIRINADDVLAVVDTAPAGLRSSMQRDRAADRPLELDALGGALLRAAARHRLAAPVTARLVAELGG